MSIRVTILAYTSDVSFPNSALDELKAQISSFKPLRVQHHTEHFDSKMDPSGETKAVQWSSGGNSRTLADALGQSRQIISNTEFIIQLPCKSTPSSLHLISCRGMRTVGKVEKLFHRDAVDHIYSHTCLKYWTFTWSISTWTTWKLWLCNPVVINIVIAYVWLNAQPVVTEMFQHALLL